MNRLFKWFIMLTKRLYKKASFVIILALIPLCIFMFSDASKEDKGFQHIILVQTNPDDKISSQIIEELMDESSVVLFTKSTSVQEATKAVTSGDAHEAWIFPSDMEKAIDEHIKIGKDKFISIIARERSVFSMLSREKLSSAVFEYTAKAFYLDFTRTQVEGLDYLSDSELMHYYDNVSIDEELFVFGNSEASSSDKQSSSNYLTSPIRGLLGILIMLCGMASALYLMQDERNGTFAWAPDKAKLPIGFGSMFIAVINVSIVAILSLFVSGLNASFDRELLVTFMYSFCCTSFCMILKLLITNMKLYAVLIPLLTIICMVLCPVFFDQNRFLRHFFPPNYYINAIYTDKYMMYMVIYTIVCLVLCFLIHIIKTSIKKVSK